MRFIKCALLPALLFFSASIGASRSSRTNSQPPVPSDAELKARKAIAEKMSIWQEKMGKECSHKIEHAAWVSKEYERLKEDKTSQPDLTAMSAEIGKLKIKKQAYAFCKNAGKSEEDITKYLDYLLSLESF